MELRNETDSSNLPLRLTFSVPRFSYWHDSEVSDNQKQSELNKRRAYRSSELG